MQNNSSNAFFKTFWDEEGFSWDEGKLGFGLNQKASALRSTFYC